MDDLLALEIDLKTAMDGLERDNNSLKTILSRMFSYQEKITYTKNMIAFIESGLKEGK